MCQCLIKKLTNTRITAISTSGLRITRTKDVSLLTVRFIDQQKVRASLHVGSCRMPRLFPLVPHIYVIKPRLRLFPLRYVDALAACLSGSAVTLSQAQTFNAIRTTRTLICEIQTEFATTLDKRAEHTPQQIAEILGVKCSIIERWIRSGALKSSNRLTITPKMLRAGIEWRIPKN